MRSSPCAAPVSVASSRITGNRAQGPPDPHLCRTPHARSPFDKRSQEALKFWMRYNVPLRFAGYVPSLAIFLMAWLPAGAQTAKEIYNFPASDAPNLVNSLVATKGATFYGSTLGVQLVNAGVIFSVSPASGGALVETVIYTFPLSDGAAFGSCYSTIGISGSGDLYGTAVSDGAYGMGSVFRLSAPAAGGLIRRYTASPEEATARNRWEAWWWGRMAICTALRTGRASRAKPCRARTAAFSSFRLPPRGAGNGS